MARTDKKVRYRPLGRVPYTPTSAAEGVEQTLKILEGSGLANLMKTLPANEQYSYVFDGNSQVLDQILVSKELLTPEPEYDSVHVNAEFSDQASDHDPSVVRVTLKDRDGTVLFEGDVR